MNRFRQLENIDTAFQLLRWFTLSVIAVCAIVTVYAIYASFTLARDAGDRIYILANGKALEAWSAERKDNIPVEARDHIAMFHRHFFTLHPDEKFINSSVTKALYLADESAKRQYDNLRENRFYSGIIAGNISQEITIDSIRLDLNQYPFYFRCFAQQRIIRTTSIVTRSLLTEGWLRNIGRSDHNPHGFLIEKWSTLQNKDIKTETRQ